METIIQKIHQLRLYQLLVNLVAGTQLDELLTDPHPGVRLFRRLILFLVIFLVALPFVYVLRQMLNAFFGLLF